MRQSLQPGYSSFKAHWPSHVVYCSCDAQAMLHLWLSNQTKHANDMVHYPWLLTQSSTVIPQGNTNLALHCKLSKSSPVLVDVLGHMRAAV